MFDTTMGAGGRRSRPPAGPRLRHLLAHAATPKSELESYGERATLVKPGRSLNRKGDKERPKEIELKIHRKRDYTNVSGRSPLNWKHHIIRVRGRPSIKPQIGIKGRGGGLEPNLTPSHLDRKIAQIALRVYQNRKTPNCPDHAPAASGLLRTGSEIFIVLEVPRVWRTDIK
ncbi:hypothetical protein EVAR_98449_1 [Eumeta japonica]|uniref:Uncharacterized protein n=1 Tax=Eumeta variegata TaxID=151549 RepID=A0A4C1YND2_EUMVA|nr:hypothetical protein EVAR_98449_1 [Eumeta japonica]